MPLQFSVPKKKVSRRGFVFTMTFRHHERFFARRVSRLTFPVQMYEHETLELSFNQTVEIS